jgi:nucleoside-diphosphate-sugar epimerase
MKVLVTGSSGFIGRHFVKHFNEAGHYVTPIDIRSHVRPTDCRDFFRRDRERYDLAIHCAANIGGRAAIDGNPLHIAANLAIDYDFFDWIVRTRPHRSVYFSSSAAYPVELQEAGSSSLHEEDIDLFTPGLPDNTYGWAKLTGERLADLVRQRGFNLHVFRPFSGYGEDQDETYPFPAFVKRAQRREDPFLVWGDGSSQRDWIHVDDVIGAVLAAIDQDFTDPLNLCTGVGTSFDELTRLVCEAAGYSPKIEYNEHAPQGVHTRVGDPARMLTVYTPKISIEQGARRAL